jgi:hypothetical protein
MAEGKAGERPTRATEAERATQDASIDRPDGERPKHRLRNGLFVVWRLIFFAVILVITVATGWHYKSLADPGAEPPGFRSQSAQYLHLYFSAYAISDHVSIYLHRDNNAHGYSYFTEEISVSVNFAHRVSQPMVVMTSSSKPSETLDPNFTRTQSATERYADALPLGYDGQNSRGEAVYSTVEDFRSIPVLFENNGSVYGHLPSVGIIQYCCGDIPTVLVEFAHRTGKVLGARTNYTDYDCANGRPARGIRLPHPADWACFGELASVSAAEYLEGVGPELSSEQIDYMNPSTANNNFDYVWKSNGCCNLEPVFKLTDPDAADSQSKAAFKSGIAFGVAAAAFIAVIQEFPRKDWPRRKRRRKSSPQDA